MGQYGWGKCVPDANTLKSVTMQHNTLQILFITRDNKKDNQAIKCTIDV